MLAHIGIDPGKKGSLCILRHDEEIIFHDFPQDDNIVRYFKELLEVLDEYTIPLAVLERVHSMPKQGVKSTFTFGTNFGMWQGFLACSYIKHILLPPQTWQKGLVASADGPDPKSRIRNIATRLYPHAELMGPKGGYKDGRADALMMAHVAALKYTPPKRKK